jgi:feruloyl esterase
VPGAGHGDPNGTSNPTAEVPCFTPTQFYDALTAWVEKGTAPDALTLQALGGATSKTRPISICVYPKKITYTSGDIGSAASYTCS